MLCEICNHSLVTSGFWERRPSRDGNELNNTSTNHHQTLESLQRSASECCYICYRLQEALGQRDGPLGRTADALHHPLTRVSWSWDAINLVFLWPDGEWDWDGVYFSVKDNSPANLSSQYNSRTYDPDDPDCSSIVQQWLEECTTKHPKRERLRDKAWFPSRLLDLRATDSDAIRLLDTSKAPPIGPYMTLSHSWGGAPIAQLERSFRRLRTTHASREFPQDVSRGHCCRQIARRSIPLDRLALHHSRCPRRLGTPSLTDEPSLSQRAL